MDTEQIRKWARALAAEARAEQAERERDDALLAAGHLSDEIATLEAALRDALAALDEWSAGEADAIRRTLGDQEAPAEPTPPEFRDAAEYRAWQRASEAPTVYSAPLPAAPQVAPTEPTCSHPRLSGDSFSALRCVDCGAPQVAPEPERCPDGCLRGWHEGEVGGWDRCEHPYHRIGPRPAPLVEGEQG